jgi:hypothetical protein
MTKKEKTCWRLAPCHVCDIEGTTSWLEEMAKTGLFLTEDGFFAGFGKFKKGKPKKVRYRLNAAKESTGLLSDNGGKPNDEELEFFEENGWKYITNRGEFNIYMTDDSSVPEIDTDSVVQSIAIEKVKKSRFSNSFCLVMWMVIYPILRLRASLIRTFIGIGLWLSIFGVLIVILLICLSARKVIYLGKLQKQLKDGTGIDYRKNWKKKEKFNKIIPFFTGALIVLWVIFFVFAEKADKNRKVALSDYTGEIPFATMTDLADGEFIPDDWFDYMNKISVKSDILAPTVIDFNQTGSVKLSDGKTLQGGLSVEYYETVSPWFSKQIASEMVRYDKIENRKYFSEMETPNVDADAIYAYSAIFPTVVIVDGCKVMRVEFYQTSGDYEMPLSQWVEVFTR